METAELKKMTIFEALAHVNAGLAAIGKNQKNQQQGFKYRGIDDVYNAVNPLFKEFGIICMPEILETQRYETETQKIIEGKAKITKLAYTLHKIKYTFYTMDGSSVSCVVQGEGMDSGDKSSNKAMAVAHKYALCQMFCIPTEDMPDPDKDAPQLGKTSKPAPKPEQKPEKTQAVAEKLFDPARIDKFTSWAKTNEMSVAIKDDTIVVSGKTFNHTKWLSSEGFKYDNVSKNYTIKLPAA